MTVRLFARARDLAGTDSASVYLPPRSTVGELRKVLAVTYPELATFLPRCAISVDGEFAEDTTPVTEESEIAILPPVSGG